MERATELRWWAGVDNALLGRTTEERQEDARSARVDAAISADVRVDGALAAAVANDGASFPPPLPAELLAKLFRALLLARWSTLEEREEGR